MRDKLPPDPSPETLLAWYKVHLSGGNLPPGVTVSKVEEIGDCQYRIIFSVPPTPEQIEFKYPINSKLEVCESCEKTSDEVEFDWTYQSDVALCKECSRALSKEESNGHKPI